MGNDLLIATLAMPVGKQPDWDAARALVQRMPEDSVVMAVEDWHGEAPVRDDGDNDVPACRAELLRLVDLVEEATQSENRHLYATEYIVPGWMVWLTGGDSWGDSPSEEFNYFNAFLGVGYPGETLAQAAGFAHRFVEPAVIRFDDSQDSEKGG